MYGIVVCVWLIYMRRMCVCVCMSKGERRIKNEEEEAIDLKMMTGPLLDGV